MKIIKTILIFILFIFIDFALWIIIGLVLLNYEDFYLESKGEYWSLASMTTIEKIAYLSYFIWIIANIILVTYFIFRFFKKTMANRFMPPQE